MVRIKVREAGQPSVWTRINQRLGEYRLLLWILLALLAALGFDFKTPAAQFRLSAARTEAVAAEVIRRDSLVRLRLDAVERDGRRDRGLLVGLARLACLTERRAALALPCDQLSTLSTLGTP